MVGGRREKGWTKSVRVGCRVGVVLSPWSNGRERLWLWVWDRDLWYVVGDIGLGDVTRSRSERKLQNVDIFLFLRLGAPFVKYNLHEPEGV